MLNNEPIKVNVTRTVTEEIQIKFPFYIKDNFDMYIRFVDIQSGPLSVIVNNEHNAYSIRSNSNISLIPSIDRIGEGVWIKITAKEFNEAYKLAMKHLRTEFNSIKANKQQ